MGNIVSLPIIFNRIINSYIDFILLLHVLRVKLFFNLNKNLKRSYLN